MNDVEYKRLSRKITKLAKNHKYEESKETSEWIDTVLNMTQVMIDEESKKLLVDEKIPVSFDLLKEGLKINVKRVIK